jgi:hypothetical protein
MQLNKVVERSSAAHALHVTTQSAPRGTAVARIARMMKKNVKSDVAIVT